MDFVKSFINGWRELDWHIPPGILQHVAHQVRIIPSGTRIGLLRESCTYKNVSIMLAFLNISSMAILSILVGSDPVGQKSRASVTALKLSSWEIDSLKHLTYFA